MQFSSLNACVNFLEKEGELIRIEDEMDPDLEMAEVHNQVFEAGGPAILFQNVKGSPFPAVSNLFGTYERAVKILSPQLEKVTTLVNLKSDPALFMKHPIQSAKALLNAFHALPRRRKNGPVLQGRCRIQDLPMIRCWPKDGGGFIYLPQVFSRDPLKNGVGSQNGSGSGIGDPSKISSAMGMRSGAKIGTITRREGGVMSSNLGMYRIQLSGNDYAMDREVGVHYQIHRGIGVHHTHALERNLPLPVSIFVGGPPAHTLAAVMPLPEGLPEVAFAGTLAGRAFHYAEKAGGRAERSGVGGTSHLISLDADFCITGRIMPGKTKPEGPFGDHLGYYSLVHDFPYLEVDAVYHRKDAIWPFTVVGRPPREDSIFGRLIHEMTASAIPDTIPGVTAVHAVDVAGVHPLLFAKAMERYVPYEEKKDKKPREILTHANAILGTGQLSLAKYLIITAHNDRPDLDIHDEIGFLMHVLERIDFRTDLHFQTCTTMDTLDYSSKGLNEGSKMVWAVAGEKKRELLRYIPSTLIEVISKPFSHPKLAAPGMMVIQGEPFVSYEKAAHEVDELVASLDFLMDASAAGKGDGRRGKREMKGLPLIVIVDDARKAADDFATFLWITFSRSNPSHDIYGVGSFTRFKHWRCKGALIIDARIKPFHAPPLVQDSRVVERVKRLGLAGGPLHGII